MPFISSSNVSASAHSHDSPASDPYHNMIPWIAAGSPGVIFGDIGISPLYSLHECFHGPPHAIAPTVDNVLGVLSLSSVYASYTVAGSENPSCIKYNKAMIAVWERKER